MVKANNKRDLSGVLLFDKATGLSSNQALQQVKRLYAAKKTGHTGTLDPLASGLLPLMFGEATKFAADLIDANKTYETTIRLGYESSTGDAEGELTPSTSGKPLDLTVDQASKVCENFVGEIEQIPPMFSALKKDGKPLYEYARAGIELERQSRKIVIHQLRVLGVNIQDAEVSLTLEVTCSKGTYVRTLGEDIAKALGTRGYLTALRRTAIGGLRADAGHTLDDLKALALQDEPQQKLDALLFPVDCLLSGLEAVELNNEFGRRFLHGQRLPLDLTKRVGAGRVRVYASSPGEDVQNMPQFLGTGILETDGKGALLRPDRLIQVNL